VGAAPRRTELGVWGQDIAGDRSRFSTRQGGTTALKQFIASAYVAPLLLLLFSASYNLAGLSPRFEHCLGSCWCRCATSRPTHAPAMLRFNPGATATRPIPAVFLCCLSPPRIRAHHDTILEHTKLQPST
jgi:hypothetical protein